MSENEIGTVLGISRGRFQALCTTPISDWRLLDDEKNFRRLRMSQLTRLSQALIDEPLAPRTNVEDLRTRSRRRHQRSRSIMAGYSCS